MLKNINHIYIICIVEYVMLKVMTEHQSSKKVFNPLTVMGALKHPRKDLSLKKN